MPIFFNNTDGQSLNPSVILLLIQQGSDYQLQIVSATEYKPHETEGIRLFPEDFNVKKAYELNVFLNKTLSKTTLTEDEVNEIFPQAFAQNETVQWIKLGSYDNKKTYKNPWDDLELDLCRTKLNHAYDRLLNLTDQNPQLINAFINETLLMQESIEHLNSGLYNFYSSPHINMFAQLDELAEMLETMCHQLERSNEIIPQPIIPKLKQQVYTRALIHGFLALAACIACTGSILLLMGSLGFTTCITVPAILMAYKTILITAMSVSSMMSLILANKATAQSYSAAQTYLLFKQYEKENPVDNTPPTPSNPESFATNKK